MLRLSAALFALDAVAALAMGVRYVRREAFMPYQEKATGRRVADLDPALRVVCLAMLRAVGGGFLAFGVSGLGLAACLWQGARFAGFAVALAAAAFMIPAYLAAASVERQAPGAGAPLRIVYAAAAVTLVAFVALLV